MTLATVDQLELIYGVFREVNKPFIYGGFKNVMRSALASALDEGRVVTVGDGIPHAVLVYEKLSSVRKYRTFEDRVVLLSKGDVLVSDFACRNDYYGEAVLKELLAAFPTSSRSGTLFKFDLVVWVEIYEEDLLAKRVLQKLDFQYVGTKIAGSSEIRGLYRYRRIGADYRALSEEHATLTEVRRHFIQDNRLAAIRSEITAYDEAFEQIGSNYNKRKSWSAFQLRGYLPDPKYHERPGTRKWDESDQSALVLQNTSIADKFPETWKFVDMIPGKKERVRFMCIKKGDGELGRHTDLYYKNIGIADGKIARFHVPIITDVDNVVFSGWDDRGVRVEGKFEEGTLFYLDFRKPHAVVNRSAIDRIHLVVDCFSCGEVRRLIAGGVPS